MPDQPEMLDFDVRDHPMFTPPAPDSVMPPAVRRLRAKLAEALTPFDGRLDYLDVLEYANTVYNVSEMFILGIDAGHGYIDLTRLMGEVTFHRVGVCNRITLRIKAMTDSGLREHDRRMEMARNNRATVERMCEQLIQAIAAL